MLHKLLPKFMRRARALNRPLGIPLALEPLEDRSLPAVTLGVAATGEISLVSDLASADETLTVERLDSTSYRVTSVGTTLNVGTVASPQITATRINTNRIDVNLSVESALSALRLQLNGGTDSVSFRESTPTGVFAAVSIDLNSANSSGQVKLENLDETGEYRLSAGALQISADGAAQLSVTDNLNAGNRSLLLQGGKSVTVVAGKSVATSGNGHITMTSKAITLGDGSSVNAGPLGDVSLQAADALSNLFLSENPIFRVNEAAATISVGKNVVITGNNVNLTADADGTAFADFRINTLALEEEVASLSGIFKGGEVAFSGNTLVRAGGSGSFVSEGFAAGQWIRVGRTQTSDGIYRVAAVTASTITLDAPTTLANETAARPTIEKLIATAGTPTLTFSDNGQDQAATITRDSGTWAGDGFTVGQFISILGSTGNALTDAEITDVDGAVLTLSLAARVTSGSETGLTIVTGQLNPGEAPLLKGDPDVRVTDEVLTFSAVAKTITRASGNWAEVGFVAGSIISVRGTATNNGLYRVAAVNNRVLTLISASTLTNETSDDQAEVVSMVEATDESGDPITVNKGKNALSGAADALLSTDFATAINKFIPFAVLTADIQSEVRLGAGAKINAAGDAFLVARAQSEAAFSNSSFLLGFTYVGSTVTARSVLEDGAGIAADGQVEISSSVNNALEAETETESGSTDDDTKELANIDKIPGPAISLTYGKARSTTETLLAAGTHVSGAQVRVLANNNNSFEVSAGSSVTGAGSSAAAGIAVAVSDVQSHSTTTVAGTIESAGLVEINSQSVNALNKVSVSAETGDDEPEEEGAQVKTDDLPGMDQFEVAEVTDVLDKVEGGDGASAPPTLGLSAALSVALSVNKATTFVGSNDPLHPATILAGGNVKVTATVEENYQNSAAGAAEATAQYSLGGAIAIGDYDNLADAHVGAGTVITTDRELIVEADAHVPYQIALLSDLESLRNIRNRLPSSADYAETTSGSGSLPTDPLSLSLSGKETLTDTYEGIQEYFSPGDLLANRLTSSFSTAKSVVESEEEGDEAKLTASGSLTYLSINNAANSSIENGALVSTGATLAPNPTAITRTTDASDEITLSGGTFTDGDRVVYHRGTPTAATGLDEGSIYTVVTDNAGHTYLSNRPAQLFDPGIGLDDKNSAFTLGTRHQFLTGQALLYRAQSSDAITGLENGKVYFAIVLDANNFKLATSRANALIGTALRDLVAEGDGAGHTFAALVDLKNATGNLGSLTVQAVHVVARASLETIDVGGLGPLDATTGGAQSVGGSVVVALKENTALAHVGDGVEIDAQHGDVNVAALAKNSTWTVVLSGGSGAKLAVNGSVGVTVSRNDTEAWIEDTAQITAAGAIRVHAEDEILAISAGGAFAQGPKAIGLTAVVYLNDATTRAFIGNKETEGSTAGTITTGGNLDVVADHSERFVTIAIAGTLAKDTSEPVAADPKDALESITNSVTSVKDNAQQIAASASGTTGKNQTEGSGLGISGDAAVIDSDSNAEAFISSVTVVATRDVTVQANADRMSFTVSGAVAISIGSDDSKTLAGSAAISLLDQTAQAYVEDATIAGQNLTIDANSSQILLGLAAGASGALAKGGVSLVGSAGTNVTSNSAEAQLGRDSKPVHATMQGNVVVDADAPLRQILIGGGLALGNKTAAGAGIAVGIFDNTARALVGDGSTVTAEGGIAVTADTTENLLSLAVQLSGSAEKFGLSGSVTVNVGNIVTQAEVGNNAELSAGGTVTVAAQDTTDAVAVAGALGFSGKGSGVGAAIVVNVFDRDVEAGITDGASVNTDRGSGGAINVTAASVVDATNVAVGGAIAGKNAFEASAIVNIDDTTTYAGIAAGANVRAKGTNGSISLKSSYLGDLKSGVGSIAVSKGTSVGASVDVELLDRETTADISIGATLSADKSIVLNAVTNEDMTHIAAAASAGKYAGAGSVLFLDADKTTRAAVGDDATLTAAGSVIVTADSILDIDAIAGSASLGLQAAFGAAVIVFQHDNDVQASVGEGANIVARGQGTGFDVYTGEHSGSTRLKQNVTGVAVVATSQQDMLITSAGASVGGKVALQGSVNVVIDNQTTHAFLGDAAKVNEADTGAAGQGLYVTAAADSKRLGIAGGLAAGGTGGIGAGIDVAVVTKDTAATVGEDALARARGNIVVKSLSTEDTTVIAASLGVGGTAGLAGSVDVSVTSINTLALVDNGADLLAQGSVIVTAADEQESDFIAGSGAGGGTAGIGASIGVVVQTKSTLAIIGEEAKVRGLGTLATGVAVRTSDFQQGAASSGTGEVNAPTNQLAGITGKGDEDAAIAGTVSAPRGDKVAVFKTVKGVAVTATSVDDFETIAASGAAAGTVAVTISGSVFVNSMTTRALIERGAHINDNNTGAGTDQSVLVAAGSYLSHLGIGGSASGAGTAGIGVGGDLSFATQTTTAAIGAGALVKANRDVVVVATAHEDIFSLAAGFAAAGVAGIAGSFSVLKIDTVTTATIGDGTMVQAGGNAIVSVLDVTSSDVIAGSLGAGFTGAGVGMSVVVVLPTKHVRAAIGSGAKIDALGQFSDYNAVSGSANLQFTTSTRRGVIVEASSREDITAIGASAGVGLYAGVGGGITVDLISVDTDAVIGAGARINHGGGAANASQDVHVAATHIFDIVSVGGAAGIGAAGIAGGIDVGVVRDNTRAVIGAGALVAAADDVSIEARHDRRIKSIAISVGGGLVGVAGAVSVWSIGAPVGSDGLDSLQTNDNPDDANAQGFLDRQISGQTGNSNSDGTSNLLGQFANSDNLASVADSDTGSRIRSGVNSSNQRLGAAGAATQTSSGLTGAATTGTVARIDAGAIVTAGDAVSVKASGKTEMRVLTGSIAVGAFAGVGGAVGLVTIDDNVQAIMAGTIVAGGNVTIAALYENSVNGLATGGAAGLVGLGAQVLIVTDNSAQTAVVANGATIRKAGDVTVEASALRRYDVKAAGAALGAVAAGAAITQVDVTGATIAHVGDGTVLGEGGANVVRSLQVRASSDNSAKAATYAVAAGIGAGTGNKVEVNLLADNGGVNVEASIGAGATIVATNDILVDSSSQQAATVDAFGVSAGGVAVAVSLATALVAPDAIASIGASNLTAGRRVRVRSRHNTNENGTKRTGTQVSATGSASAGGLIGGAGADVSAENRADVHALVAAGAIIKAGDEVAVLVDTDRDATANAGGVTLGVVGVGVMLSEAKAEGISAASFDGRGETNAFTVRATDATQAFTDTTAAGGGLISVGINKANALAGGTTAATLGKNAFVKANGVTVLADADATGSRANVYGLNIGGFTVGGSNAQVDVSPTVTATLGDGASVHATGTLRIESKLREASGTASATSGSGALAAITGVDATVNINSNVATTLGAGANLVGEQDVFVLATSANRASTNAQSTAIAGFGGQDADAEETIRTTARIDLGTASKLKAGTKLSVAADNRVTDRSYAKTVFYGLGSFNAADAQTTVSGVGGSGPLAAVTLGEASQVEASDLVVEAKVSELKVDSDAEAELGAIGGGIRTRSDVKVTSNTLVDQMRDATVSADTIRIYSGQSNINVDSLGKGNTSAFIGAHDGQVFDRLELNSDVRTAAGSMLLGRTVDIEARAASAADRIVNATVRTGDGIDPSSDDYSMNVVADNTIEIGGILVGGIKIATLKFDTAGNVLVNRNMTVNRVGNVLKISINEQTPAGSITLTALAPNLVVLPDPDADDVTQQLTGDVVYTATAKQQYLNRIRSVEVINPSALDLEIGAIDMMKPGPLVSVTVRDANNMATGTLVNGGVLILPESPITITSNTSSLSDVTLTGKINNPDSSTTIAAGGNLTINANLLAERGQTTLSAGGSILTNPATGTTALITTSDLVLTATAGAIGTAARPLLLNLLRDGGTRAASLTADAVTGVSLNLLANATPEDTFLRSVKAPSGAIALDFGGNKGILTGAMIADAQKEVTLLAFAALDDQHHNEPFDISGGDLTLIGTGSVGSKDDAVELQVHRIEAHLTSGDLFVGNRGEVTVGGINSSLTGLQVSGEIGLFAEGPINVTEDIRGGNDVRLATGDSANRTDDEVKLSDGVHIESSTGNLALLAGDTLHLNNTHRLIAAREITLGMDYGNGDGGVGINFTLPTEASGILTAASLRVLTAGDDDSLIIPDLWLPTNFESGAGRDAVDLTLTRAASAQTVLTNFGIEKVTFRTTVEEDHNWLVDSAEVVTPLFDEVGAAQSYRTVQTTLDGFALIRDQNTVTTDREAIQATYTFTDAVDTLNVLRLEHALTVDLKGGDDVAQVGGMRGSSAVAPSEVFQKLTLEGGAGTDQFLLVDPRVGGQFTPLGRLDALDADTGLVRDYDFDVERPNSPRSIVFAHFEGVDVDLGDTSAIFSVNNTVAPTVIHADKGDDVVNVLRTAHHVQIDMGAGNDDINIQGLSDLVDVMGGAHSGSLSQPENGDRLRIGATRLFNNNVVNVLGANHPGTIAILGHGWFTGQEVIFTTSGTAPTGLVAGLSYFVIRDNRNEIRLAATRTDALNSLAIAIPDGGFGEHQLTMAENGHALWQRSLSEINTDDGTGAGVPVFTLTQPLSEQPITFDPANGVIHTAAPHGLSDGQKVALFTDGSMPVAAERFYYVVNAQETNFQLALTPGGAAMPITGSGQGNHVVARAGEVRIPGKDVEKVNILLGIGNDTLLLDNTADNLQMEIRGGPGDDTFILREVRNTSVVRGDEGANDTIRLIVSGMPLPNQFAKLQVGAGIERLLIDNTDNPLPVDWIVAEANLYFEDGAAVPATVDAIADRFTATGHGFQTGDGVLLNSAGTPPTYFLDGHLVTAQPRDFFYVIRTDADTFRLAFSAAEAEQGIALDFGTVDAVLEVQRLALLTSLEGAQRVGILSGRSDTDGDGKPNADGNAVSTLSVLSGQELSAEVSGNSLRLTEGVRVLDHSNSLQKLSFPAFRVDGLQGVRSVVAVTTADDPATTANDPRHWIVAAGTEENKIAIFERRTNPDDANDANLEFVTVRTIEQGLPTSPSRLKVSPDGRYLYVIGADSIVVFKLKQVKGLLDIEKVDTLDSTTLAAIPTASVNLTPTLGTPTDIVFNADGTRAYVADAGSDDGILVFERNVATGMLTKVLDKRNRENSFGSAIDVGNDPIVRGSVDTTTGDIHVIDEPLTGSLLGQGVFRFYAAADSIGKQITPLLFKPIGEDDHTDPNGLGWTIAAVGTTRTIEHVGLNEFAFETVSGSAVGSGFYFGWKDGSAATDESGIVTYATGTASNAFAGAAITLDSGTALNGVSYQSGRAYSIQGLFAITEISGLANPHTLAISQDGNTVYSGDTVGFVASWVRQADDTLRLPTKTEWQKADTKTNSAASFGRAVELALANNGDVRLTATGGSFAGEFVVRGNGQTTETVGTATAGSGVVTIGDTIVTGDGNENKVYFGTSGTTPTSSSISIDTSAVSIATNDKFVIVGAPMSDRNHPVLGEDDTGAVVILKRNGSSLSTHQVLWPTTGNPRRYGASVAMDGNQALISYVDGGGMHQVELWSYDSGTDRWNLTTTVTGGELLDIDHGIAILGTEGGAVKIWEITNNRTTNVSINPIAVSIDGNVASVLDAAGNLHILRRTDAGAWLELQVIATGATASRVSITDNDPFVNQVTLNFGHQYEGSGESGDEEVYIVQVDFTDFTSKIVFNPNYDSQAYDEDFPIGYSTVIPDGHLLAFVAMERDDANADDNGGAFFVDNNTAPGTYTADLNDEFGIRINYTISVVPMGNTDIFTTDIQDALGDMIAVGVPGSGKVDVYSEVTRQVAQHQGIGSITDILVSPDGGALYVTDAAGKVYVLGATPPTDRALNLLDTETNNQDSVNGIGAAQDVAVSADGSTVYVTGKTADGTEGAVAAFTRNTSDNTLTRLADINNPQRDGIGGTKGLFGGTAEIATTATFGNADSFAVVAGSGDDTLVSFGIDANGVLAYDQGPNPDAGTQPFGLKDGDPAGTVKQVRGLVANPIYNELYAVSTDASNLYVLTEQEVAPRQTRFKVTVFFHDEADGVTGLAGASAIAVSADGNSIYVLAVGEAAGSRIALFQRTGPGTIQFISSFASSVLEVSALVDPVLGVQVSPDGDNVYVSGPGGLEVYARNSTTGDLTSVQMLGDAVSTIVFNPAAGLAYATSPASNKLFVYDRAADGMLSNRRAFDTRLNQPTAVVLSPAITGTQTVAAGRFVYVASEGNGTITVFEDKLGNGNLVAVQTVGEGSNGARGLGGVSALQLSAAVDNVHLTFEAGDIDADGDIIRADAHGLKTGQAITLTGTAPTGLSGGTTYYVRRLSSQAFQLAVSEAAARLGEGMIDLQTSSGTFTMETDIAAGAYLYSLGTGSSAIANFERDTDPNSLTFGRLRFVQLIRNRVGNAVGGANDGLFRPDSIALLNGDTARVFVSSSFDPLVDGAPGGLVTLTNNAHTSPALPPLTYVLDFENMATLDISTGAGNDRINVLKAPKDQGNPINLTISTSDGDDEVTLNAFGPTTNIDLGAGADKLTIRRVNGGDPVVNVNAGVGADEILIEAVGGDTTTINLSTGAGSDSIQISGRDIAAGNSVNLMNDSDDTVVYQTQGAETAGDVLSGNNLQVAGFGSVSLATTQNLVIESQSDMPVAHLTANSVRIRQGQSVTLDASSSVIPALPPGGFVTYAWDFNLDGEFTELMGDSPIVELPWSDLLDRVFGDYDSNDELAVQVWVRLTRTVPVLDAFGEVVGFASRSNDAPLTLTIVDVPPTIRSGNEASFTATGARPEYQPTLSFTDPGNEIVVRWTVAWGDGTETSYDSAPVPQHIYAKPGTYTINATAVDERGHVVMATPRVVEIAFDASVVRPGGPYASDEGAAVTLVGSSLGAPDSGSFAWTVNGQTAGSGPILNLTWAQLQQLGVTNDGTYAVALTVTYNDGAVAVTSVATQLVIGNVAPTAQFDNSGPVDEDQAATVVVKNVTDVVDAIFTYSYDFYGTGTFVPGTAQQSVPADLLAQDGVHIIRARVHDGTGFTEVQTELKVRAAGPQLAIDNNRVVVVGLEGETATLSGTIHNPGNDAVSFSSNIGTVTQTSSGTWLWESDPAADGPGDGAIVTITALDEDGLSNSVTFRFMLVNVGPTAVFTNSGPVQQGSSAVVHFGTPVDPATADNAAGFTYSYDLGDGNYVTGTDDFTVPAELLVESGEHTIHGRIHDKDGSADFTTTIVVQNVAPVISATLTPELNEADEATLDVTFTDPGTRDLHSVRVNWGDGTVDRITLQAGERGFTLKHHFNDNASQSDPDKIYTVTVSIDDGTTEVTETLTSVVHNVAPTIDEVKLNPLAFADTPIKLSGVFADISPDDTRTVSVDWGDGETTTAVVGGRETINFETAISGASLSNGTVVTNQFTANNQGFTVSTTNRNLKATIFDSANPGTHAALGTPHTDFGGAGVGLSGARGARGQNDQQQNNVLVLQSGADIAAGGTLVFSFASAVHVETVDLLNVNNTGGRIRLYDADGQLVSTTTIPLGGRNSLQRVSLTEGTGLITRMEVQLTNDAAITGLAYRYPDPSTFALAHTPTLGARTVKVTLMDDDGDTAGTIEQTMRVLAPLPTFEPLATGLGTLQVAEGNGVLRGMRDVDNSPLRVVLVGGTSFGTVTLNEDGSVNYVPNPGFSGIDTFTIRYVSGEAFSDPIVVSLRILPPPVVAEAMANAALPLDLIQASRFLAGAETTTAALAGFAGQRLESVFATQFSTAAQSGGTAMETAIGGSEETVWATGSEAATGVILGISTPSTITGRVMLNGAVGGAQPRLAGLALVLEIRQDDRYVEVARFVVWADGRYNFPVLQPGTYRLRLVGGEGTANLTDLLLNITVSPVELYPTEENRPVGQVPAAPTPDVRTQVFEDWSPEGWADDVTLATPEDEIAAAVALAWAAVNQEFRKNNERKRAPLQPCAVKTRDR